MSKIILFHFPGACSRVTLNALEEIGLAYEERVVDLHSGSQNSGRYLSVNPKGKVPAISFDRRIMTENAAILAFLHKQYPKANLLPRSHEPLQDAQGLIDLVWCSATIHPIVRQVRMPSKFTSGDPAGVRDDGFAKFAKEAERFSDRFTGGAWWYGKTWSILDVYICWAYSTAEKGGFPLRDYPKLGDHAARVRARPSFGRALARERAAVERHNIEMPLEMLL